MTIKLHIWILFVIILLNMAVGEFTVAVIHFKAC